MSKKQLHPSPRKTGWKPLTPAQKRHVVREMKKLDSSIPKLRKVLERALGSNNQEYQGKALEVAMFRQEIFEAMLLKDAEKPDKNENLVNI